MFLAVVEDTTLNGTTMIGFNIEASSPIANFKLPNGIKILEIIFTKSDEIVIIGSVNELAVAIWIKLIVGVTRELNIEKLGDIKCPIFASRNRYSSTNFAILSKCKEENKTDTLYLMRLNDDYSTSVVKKEDLDSDMKGLELKIEFCNRNEIALFSKGTNKI